MKENTYSKDSFFDATEDILFVLDTQGNFRQVNPTAERVLGYSQHDLLLKPLTDFVHPDDIKQTKTEIEKLQNGLPIIFEILFRTKVGSYRCLSWSMTPRKDTVFAIVRDITRAKSDLDKLKTAQNRLRLLHQATSDPAQTLWQKVERVLNLGNQELKTETAILANIKIGTRTIIRSVSKVKAPQPGEEQDISKTFDDIVLKADKTIAIHDAEASVYSEHPAHTECGIKSYIGIPLILRDDIYGVLSFESSKKREEAYNITDFDFIYSLGEWISSTLSLLKANEHIAYNAAIVGSSDDAIIGQSIDGVIESVNAGAEKLLQYSEKELLGKKYTTLFPQELRESIDTLRERLLKGERMDHHQTIYKRKDGNVVDVSLSLSPILDDERNFVGFSSIARDITKEKQIDRAKTEFVSLASHQLRTPLSAIVWYSELLLKGSAGKLKDKQKDFVNEIFAGTRRILRLVNDLLNVSRIELGKFAIRPEEMELPKMIHSVLKEASRLIISKNIEVEEKYPKDFPRVQADPSLLRMAVQNLITNSLEYTPPRGLVSISLKFDKENYSIEVKDTGYGIPFDEQEHVFEKLYRGSNVVKYDTDGTGLGLYIAKYIVDASGGTITFESEENVGTTFLITLPIKGVSPINGEKELT